jgi:ribonucleases P/MRP protein subunit RPP25
VTQIEEKKNEERKERPQKKHKESDIGDNEIRVQAKGQIKNYLGYAFRILNKTDHRSLNIRATGNAIVKALILIELVKRRVGNLHQTNKIYSLEIKTEEECKIEGMPKVETKRRVTAMDTQLSKDPLDSNDPGYQVPEPKEESHGPTPNSRPARDGGKGRKRGTSNYQPASREKKDEEKDKRQDRHIKGRHETDNNTYRGKRGRDKRGGAGARGGREEGEPANRE